MLKRGFMRSVVRLSRASFLFGVIFAEYVVHIQIEDLGRIKNDTVKQLADPGLAKGELRELMRSFEYPEGWFFVERSVAILFGLVARIAPRLNTVQVGFPYAMRLLAHKAQHDAAAAAVATPPAA